MAIYRGNPAWHKGADLRFWQRAAWPLVRRYTHWELPRYGHLLRRIGVTDHEKWAGAPTVHTRGRFYGHVMELDLADFYQRTAYFFGSYHELDIMTAIERAIRPGEVFVDGGANIGLVSMHIAEVVGPSGRVHAFECSSKVLPRLRFHLRENRLQQVTLHELGLGDVETVLTMRLPGAGNDGASTFSPVPDRYGGVFTDLGTVKIVRADDVLDRSDTRPLVVKLDVEGYEIKALRGMERTLHDRKPAIITEVNAEMLEHCGGSGVEMHSMLGAMGYRGFAVDRGGFRSRHRFWLHPLEVNEIAWERDVMWIAEGSFHWERLRPLMQQRGMYWKHIEFARQHRAATA
ncbi:MAG: FkbM family methyltransferase [Phycisphaeraceae bacterium]|nr:FkbM family methyltransferase [Phycisphaeraceae bacterium]